MDNPFVDSEADNPYKSTGVEEVKIVVPAKMPRWVVDWWTAPEQGEPVGSRNIIVPLDDDETPGALVGILELEGRKILIYRR